MRSTVSAWVLPALCLSFLVPPSPAQTWTQLRPSASPGGTSTHALAQDFARRRIVMYGGRPFTDETWEWDGNNWTRMAPATKPPALASPGFSHDVSRRRSVLFGGETSSGWQNQTWEWDGNNWSKINPPVSPAERYAFGQAYDWARQRTVVWGGLGKGGLPYLNDTWTFDGKNWTKVATTGPTGRTYPAMAYDVSRQVVVFFGGFALGNDLDDTWEWNGKTWQQIQTAKKPPKRWGMAMSYDFQQRRIVMFGGQKTKGGTVVYNDTWAYDGKNWTLLSPSQAPSPRRLMAMAHDMVNGGTLLFGGSTGTNETWLFRFGSSVPARYTAFGRGCKGSGGVPALAAATGSLPWINGPFTIELRNLPSTGAALLAFGVSNAWWGNIPLPLPLDGLGMTGCTLNASPDLFVGLNIAAGMATLKMTLPNDTRLVGSQFHNQGIVVDRPANAGGLTTSNGATAVIGKK